MTFAGNAELGNMATISLYIDADACPVKQEVYRVAERHARKGTALKVFVVSNAPIAVPCDMFAGGCRSQVGDRCCCPPADRARRGRLRHHIATPPPASARLRRPPPTKRMTPY